MAFPPWLKIRVSANGIAETGRNLHARHIHTVCEAAACPNLARCWRCGHATVLILGDVCTRNCRFCNVATGKPSPLDPDEPRRVAERVREEGIREIVLTSVTRDDLPDGGARPWAETIAAIHAATPKVRVEALVPDFRGEASCIETVLESQPEIFAHNLETVPRLYPRVRPQADYARSLSVLRRAAERGAIVKTSLMLGLGETEAELLDVFRDARAAGVDILFLGQYLRPSKDHLPVAEFVTPERFQALGEAARSMGFGFVASAPLVRSSYPAEGQREFVAKRLPSPARPSP